MRRLLIVAAILEAFWIAPSTPADTLRVPSDHSSIQDAIDASEHGDIIVVAPGVYEENITFRGKAIWLRSDEGPAQTVLDGGEWGPVVTIPSETASGSVLEGFTIRNGWANGTPGVPGNGGGIYCFNAHPRITDNIIENNKANIRGGGIFCEESDAEIRNNVVRSNEAWRGAGIAGVQSFGVIQGNTIESNTASDLGGGIVASGAGNPCIESNLIRGNGGRGGGGICIDDKSRAIIVRNRIEGNSGSLGAGVLGYFAEGGQVLENVIVGNSASCCGGGILTWVSFFVIANNIVIQNESKDGAGVFLQTDAVLTGNTIWGNTASGIGGGIMCNYCPETEISNCIIRGNAASEGNDLFVKSASPLVLHSDVGGGWPGPGNIDDDPLFVDPEAGDFHLRLGSPCIDRGENSAAYLPDVDYEGDVRIADGDLDTDAVVDMGADEVLPEVAARWGSVNAANDRVANVLFINGSAGDHQRVVTLSIMTSVTVSMIAPPQGPEPAPFALYAWALEPDPTTLVIQPHGIGVTCLATPLQPELPQPMYVWNNLGAERLFGEPIRPSTPAPSNVLERFARYRAKVTLQGFIVDFGSTADGPISATNAVVLRITR